MGVERSSPAERRDKDNAALSGFPAELLNELTPQELDALTAWATYEGKKTSSAGAAKALGLSQDAFEKILHAALRKVRREYGFGE